MALSDASKSPLKIALSLTSPAAQVHSWERRLAWRELRSPTGTTTWPSVHLARWPFDVPYLGRKLAMRRSLIQLRKKRDFVVR